MNGDDQLPRTASSASRRAAIQASADRLQRQPDADAAGAPPIRSESAPAIGAMNIGVSVHGRIRSPEPSGE